MKKVLLLLMFHCLCQYAVAQFPGYSKFYECNYAGSNKSSAIDALMPDESGQHLYFTLNANPNIDGITMASILTRTDLNGNIEYQYFDTMQNVAISYNSLVQSEDGQYFYWFATTQDLTPGQNNPKKLKVMKTDLELNKTWEKFYPLNNSNYGTAISVKSIGNNDLLIYYGDTITNAMRLDSAGSVLNFYTLAPGTSFILTDEKGWIITSPQTVYKYDSLATQQWNEGFFMPPSGNHFRESLRSNESDETYYATGQNILMDYSNPNWDMAIFSGMVLKYTNSGNPVWHRSLPIGCVAITDVAPLVDFYPSIGLQSIANASSDNIVLAGAGTKDPVYWQNYKAIIARVDSNGNILWNHFYMMPDIKKEVLTNIISLPDGSFVASGYVDSAGDNNKTGWLLRIDSLGCYNASCTGMETPEPCPPLAVNTVNIGDIDLNIFPNPAANKINIQPQTDFGTDSWLEVYDIYGKLIIEPVSLDRKKQYVLDAGRWANGHYFLKFKIDGQLFCRKMVVLH